MDFQLQNLRKKAGYASRESFAEAYGVSERKLKAWERQETKITMEDACLVADFLHCSLDELAGRDWSPGDFADPGKTAIIGCYDSMNEKGRALLVDNARLMSASPEVRMVKDGQDSGDKAALA